MVLLYIYVSFCPRIPNHDIVPALCPGHYEQAQSVVIEYVHTVVLHTGRDATAGLGPSDKMVSCRWISEYYREKRLFASIGGNGHASVWFGHCSLVQ